MKLFLYISFQRKPMRIINLFSIGLIVCMILPIFWNCKKEAPQIIPTVTVSAVTNLAADGASGGGEVTDDGGAEVTARGICWGTAKSPSISGTFVACGTGTGSFSGAITGINPGTTYYVRAYATNAVGTGYSEQATFNTLTIAPLISTTSITDIGPNSATSGGNVTSDGGSAIFARGICWSIAQNPKITDSKTVGETGTGTFVSAITGLVPATTYFVRAYATNSAGTNYGNQVSFTTSAVLATITTNIATGITSGKASSGGVIVSDGGSPITAKGVCWSKSVNPTTANSKTVDGTGSGTFTSSLTGLQRVTTYYIRAYAINSMGTVYGNQVAFTTNPTLPTLTTQAASTVQTYSAIVGGNITDDGGAFVTARGFAYNDPILVVGIDYFYNISIGNGIGIFSGTIGGLDPATTYTGRAYATNSAGTAYGNEISFTTNPIIIIITGKSNQSIIQLK